MHARRRHHALWFVLQFCLQGCCCLVFESYLSVHAIDTIGLFFTQHLLTLFLSFILQHQSKPWSRCIVLLRMKPSIPENRSSRCVGMSSKFIDQQPTALDKISLGQEAVAPILWISECSSGAWDNRKQMSLEWYTQALSLTTYNSMIEHAVEESPQ